MKEENFQYNATEYAARLKILEENARCHKQIEDIAANDLKEQGFEVVRFGGIFTDIFQDKPKNHRMNYFNFVSLTTPERNPRKMVILMEGNAFFNQKFKEKLKKHMPSKKIIGYYDRTSSRALLSMDGGLHCTIRPL